MCGNGLRCVAKYLYDYDDQAKKNEGLLIDTGAGPLLCQITQGASGLAQTVTVDMGAPRLTRNQIPMTGPEGSSSEESPINDKITIGNRDFLFTSISMGNPHTVTFVEQCGADLRALAESVGPDIEKHPWFPQKTNVEFAHLHSPTEIELVVWERGCGITLACGTGACATVAAACLTERASLNEEVTVKLLGGDLAISVTTNYQTAFMRGPATEVYTAALDLADLEFRA